MLKLVTSKQIQKLEADFIKSMNLNSSISLMEKAGTALGQAALEYSEPYLIVCGKGNNGGDGIVAARYLYNQGKKIFLFLTSDESSLSNDAKINFDLIKNKIHYLRIESDRDENFISALNTSNTIIDCLLGTGANNKLIPLFEWIIKEINNSSKTVIACDLPTGINPDTGAISECTIKANLTVTFGYTKLGLCLFPGKKHAGKIKTIDIGLPEIETNIFLMDNDFLKENFPKRPVDSNKGTFGKTLLVSGSKTYPGAAMLASCAASSIGSGLTALASPDESFNQITSGIPEVTHVNFSLESILQESFNSSVLVIGPGLTTESEIKNLVESIIRKANLPIVLDADGINVLSGNIDILKEAKKEVVITPHPKEFARFLGITVEEVLNNKINLVKDTALDLNCTIVLKGPGTIIATKAGKIYISPFANAALAKGGTGDVLSGFIGGLIAQKLEPSLAACVGVYIHGLCGELVADEKTVFSLLPQDLISYLPRVIKDIV